MTVSVMVFADASLLAQLSLGSILSLAFDVRDLGTFDADTGHQPLLTEDKSVGIIFKC